MNKLTISRAIRWSYSPTPVPAPETAKPQPVEGPTLLEFAKSKLSPGIAAKITSESQVESFRAQWEKERAAKPSLIPPNSDALPDVEVFQLTAEEAVRYDEDIMWEAHKQFPLASMNSLEQSKALAWAVEESGCTGGWFWQSCFPGCMPDSEPMGPFQTKQEAIADAQSNNDNES